MVNETRAIGLSLVLLGLPLALLLHFVKLRPTIDAIKQIKSTLSGRHLVRRRKIRIKAQVR